MNANPFVGSWTYRSLLNDPDSSKTFNDLKFGQGKIVIQEADFQRLTGTIGGSSWSLKLHGSLAYGSPMQACFQGWGLVNGEEWIYNYIAWLVPDWPDLHAKTLQRTAMVGSVIRTIPHSSSRSNSGSPAPSPSPHSSSNATDKDVPHSSTSKDVPHSSSTSKDVPSVSSGTAPAGVVASFYAVKVVKDGKT